MGTVLAALDRTGQAHNMLVLFTSDNGPWLQFGNHAGSAGPLREGKGTVFEGGIRESCVARLPGVIPAGSVSDALLSSIDILPTVAALTGEPLPVDRDGSCTVAGKRIDGHDRRVRWKLLLPHTASSMTGQEPGQDGRSGKPAPLKVGRELYDLRADVAELHDVAAEHREIVAQLQEVAEAARAELGDSLTGRKGTGVPPPGGVVAPPQPRPVAATR